METGYSPFHPSHVNYFTKDSIINLLHDTGFIVNLGFSTFPMERLALSGLDYVRRPRLGLVAHWVRMLYEARLMIFNPNRLLQIRGNWYRLGIGREIELWARKV